MDDVFIRLKELPERIGGLTVLDENGDYNVYINSRWGFIGQRETTRHEQRHIDNNDFFNGKTIAEVERLAK